MATDKEQSPYVFFLGAGASVAAGVPDTYSFVNEFIDYLKDVDANKKRTIKKIVEILKEWKGEDIDIELLLETLTKLKNKEQEPLLRFYKNGDFVLRGYSEKEPLIDDLKDFIKARAIVSEENIKYLQPFITFEEKYGPLNIISVNYDTCIEQFCNVYKINYQDGFDDHWNPKTFKKENTDICLYKLHGSVMWYQSDRGDYIKLLVKTDKSKVALMTGEKAENLMLYPMQKWDFAEPLLELLIEFKHLIESEKCQYLIVIGYSFRDEYIRKIIWDVARKNKEFHLIFISPSAYNIYYDKLKYYDNEHTIPSHLSGKVICLPYLFEKIFPYLEDIFLRNLRIGLTSEQYIHEQEIQRTPTRYSWLDCIEEFADAEYYEKVENLLNKVNIENHKEEWDTLLKINLQMTINLFIGNQEEKALVFFERFNSMLLEIAVNGIYINIIRDPLSIEIGFNYREGSHVEGKKFKEVIDSYIEFCNSRKKFACDIGNEFQEFLKGLEGIIKYLKSFEDGKIDYHQYLQLRQDKIPNIDVFRRSIEEYQKKFSKELLDELSLIIKEVEKKILIEIIRI